MGWVYSTNVGEKEKVQVIGGTARGKETTMTTKTYVCG
jgi:hypothetical protein